MVYLWNEQSDLTLCFKFGHNFKFDIVFVFETDEDNLERRYKITLHDNKAVIIDCWNFNDTLGVGTVSPIEIATIENKKMYIHFWVFLLGNKEENKLARKIEYTVFKER